MQYVLLSMLVGALFGGGMALAQSTAEPEPTRKVPRFISHFNDQFKSADKNGDGALTREEAQSAGMKSIVDNFDRIDANKDGKVTREEIRVQLRARISS